jgi:predicted amidohydrolase
VAANLTGSIGDVDLAGQSVVVDAWGTERANAGNGPRTLHANLDRGETADVRETFPVLRDRRISLQYRIGESRRAAGSSPD